MSTLLDITVGDTGVTISGTLSHVAFKSLLSTAGLSLTVSCPRVDGGGTPLFSGQSATIGTLDTTTGTLTVSYRLVTADVAVPGKGKIRWALTLADGGVIHAPGPFDKQTYLRILA